MWRCVTTQRSVRTAKNAYVHLLETSRELAQMRRALARNWVPHVHLLVMRVDVIRFADERKCDYWTEVTAGHSPGIRHAYLPLQNSGQGGNGCKFMMF
jgi:hypothetical protein